MNKNKKMFLVLIGVVSLVIIALNKFSTYCQIFEEPM